MGPGYTTAEQQTLELTELWIFIESHRLSAAADIFISLLQSTERQIIDLMNDLMNIPIHLSILCVLASGFGKNHMI